LQQPTAADEQHAWHLRRERSRAGLKLVLLTILLAFAAGIGNSPLFWVNEVQVIAPDPELGKKAAQALHLPAQVSTLFYPISRLEQQLRQVPTIQAVEIDRQLPRRLIVRVTRREPVAVVTVVGSLLLVAQDGVITEVLEPREKPPPLPVIVGLATNQRRPGEQLSSEAVGLVAEMARATEASGLGPGVELDCSQPFDLRLSAQGVEGFLGGTDNLERKVRLFAQLLTVLRKRGHNPAYIDVRIMERPVWRSR